MNYFIDEKCLINNELRSKAPIYTVGSLLHRLFNTVDNFHQNRIKYFEIYITPGKTSSLQILFTKTLHCMGDYKVLYKRIIVRIIVNM